MVKTAEQWVSEIPLLTESLVVAIQDDATTTLRTRLAEVERRLQTAEMLLRDVDNEELDSEAWAERRDAFLNPKAQQKGEM